MSEKEKAPLCPKCKTRPRVEGKNSKRKYHAYCRECETARHRKHRKSAGHNIIKYNENVQQLCPICEKRNKHPCLKFCQKCHNDRKSTQPPIWYQVAFKLRELNEYMRKNAEYPPEMSNITEDLLVTEIRQFFQFASYIREGLGDE